jgi:alpha-galactosidase
VELVGRWSNAPGFGSLLALKLRNTSSESITITRLVFPTENGLDSFLSIEHPEHLAFLRNGYQSWSTARSYRLTDRPLRPWLKVVSLASSNMSNLPSNEPGLLSSEMYAVISNLETTESFLVGQAEPFNQFFYVRLRWTPRSQGHHFQVVFDFGRKLLPAGAELELDGIFMARGKTIGLQHRYFDHIKRTVRPPLPKANITGWNSWYCFHNKLGPEDILRNVAALRDAQLELENIQVDDGYQTKVGDWLTLRPQFAGAMAGLADAIRDAGYRPGIWIAPFVAERGSELLRDHPEYLLRNEHGRPSLAGFNLFWPGHRYYGLDITHDGFADYLRKVIHTMVDDWGYELLKCDFLFGGCLRGGVHKALTLSRAEVLKHGMRLIRDAAGTDTTIVGCGMPLSAGIGTVNVMRIGTDTGPYWTMAGGKVLNTGAAVGVRNAIRNTMVRSPMHRRLWLNDADCLLIRTTDTKLSEIERMSQINALILAGGPSCSATR